MSDTDTRIVGYTRSGRPVFAVAGAAPEADEDKDKEPAADKDADGKTAAEIKAELTKALAEAEKWKALSRKHEGNAKTNADAAAKLKAAEDAQKSAEDRAEERLKELEAKINETEAELLRTKVASAKGLTPAQAKRLQGATIEELEADADDLLESFKPAAKDGEEEEGESDKDKQELTSGGRPREALRPGASNSDKEEPDVAAVIEKIPRDRF